MLKLYSNGGSPYVRKVHMVLHETGQMNDVELITAMGTALDSSNMPVAQNPAGKVPTLVRPDGPAMYDSRVICRYLDTRADAGLYGRPSDLWDILTIEATAEGMLDALVLMTTERKIRPEELQYQPWMDGQWAKVERSLAALEALWMAHLAGPFGIAHISVICALGYADFRHADRDWRGLAPKLTEWFAAHADRPSVAATVPAL